MVSHQSPKTIFFLSGSVRAWSQLVAFGDGKLRLSHSEQLPHLEGTINVFSIRDAKGPMPTGTGHQFKAINGDPQGSPSCLLGEGRVSNKDRL